MVPHLTEIRTLVNSHFVNYNTEQSLTDEQKARAKANIGISDEIYIGEGDMPDDAVLQIVVEEDSTSEDETITIVGVDEDGNSHTWIVYGKAVT